VDDATQAYLKAKAADAMGMAGEQLLKVKKIVEDGESTWKYMGFIAGCLIMCMSFLGALSSFFGLGLVSCIMYMYLFAAGALMVCLEFKHALIPVQYKEIIRREALFIYRPYGRAGFYIFVGLIMMGLGGLLTPLVGLYSAGVGAYIYYGSTNAMKALDNMKKGSEDPVVIRAKFQSADKNGDGFLDSTELAAICADMGTTLNKNELESALFMLDKNGDGKVSLEEFQVWWGVQELTA
jgi:hypothetical protein